VTITNLISRNGTRVNSEEVSSSQLQDGDVIRLGRVSLMFKNPPSNAENNALPGLLQLAILLAALALAITLGSILLF